MKNNNKLKGITLMEALVSLTILTTLVTGFVFIYEKKIKDETFEIFGLELLKYVKLVDEKVSISGYRADHWPVKNAVGYPDFKTFMYNNFNAVGTNCGISDGWVPIVDRTNDDSNSLKEKSELEKSNIAVVNQKELLNCQYFYKKDFFLGIIPEVRVNLDTDSKNINSVDFLFKYDTDAKLEENFIHIKKSLDFMKTQDVGNYFGSHFYTFVDINDIENDLLPLTCFNLGANCAMKMSFKRNGGQDYIRTDGLNSIEDSLITFKVYDYDGKIRSNVSHGIIKNCDKWVYNSISKSWTKNTTFKCGVGMYKDDLVASLLDGNATIKTIYLNKQCNKFNLTTTNGSGLLSSVPSTFVSEYTNVLEKDSKILPCGIFEDESEYIVVTDIVHAAEVNIGGKKIDGSQTSELIVHPSEEMILEDYQAKQAYDAAPPLLTGDEAVTNPSKFDFKKPSRSVVERVQDPSLSFVDNTIKNVTTKNLVVYEDLIVNSTSSLPPEQVFTTGELEVLNNYTLTRELEITSNVSLTTDQKDSATRELNYSSIKGAATVAEDLNSKNLVVGNDKLFELSATDKKYDFKNNPENIADLAYKTTGSLSQIASRIKTITANKDIAVKEKSEANDNLTADTFQFIPNPDVKAGFACDKNGVIGADNVYELFMCQNNIWEGLVQDGGISAFNSNVCPLGWREYTEADGRSLIGTGYFDTLHAGIVQYKTGDSGGEIRHKLTIEEMPAHSHNRPSIQHICQACHANLGLAKIANGNGIWNRIAPTGMEGGDKDHENRSPYFAAKFCIKGTNSKFDYIEANILTPNDIWIEYEVEYGDFTDTGTKYDCFSENQIDNISDPSDPKEYEVKVCKQDQVQIIKKREMNTRTYAIRYTGATDNNYQTIITQESWKDYDPNYTECEEKGSVYDCSSWSPDVNTIDYGLSFSQSRTCSVERVRYKQVRKRNWITGVVKIVSQSEETCYPPATKTEYLYATGTNVSLFKEDVSFSKLSTSYGGYPRYVNGSFDINSNVDSIDYGNLGIPLTNSKGHTVMIKIMRQERSTSGFSCNVSVYAVNGSEANSSGSNSGTTESWLTGYKYLRFYKSSGSQIGGTINLGSVNVDGNHSYKINSNDVCSTVETLYDNNSSIKSISLDDI